jgi:hypothetical protein
MGDFNRDGKVNDADAAILAAHWTVPGVGAEGTAAEPSTLVLLVTGGILVLCRRRIRRRLIVRYTEARTAPPTGRKSGEEAA